MECVFHGFQSAVHPLTRGNAIILVALLEARGREEAVIRAGEGPDSGVWSRGGGNGTKLIADDHMSEVIHVEIVPVIAEGVLDFFTSNQETEEDESHRSCTRDCNPAQGFPYLEGKDQTVDDSDDPEVDRIRERDGRGQNTFKAGQRVSEGE